MATAAGPISNGWDVLAVLFLAAIVVALIWGATRG